jgi:hypothetical protein
MEGSAGKPLTAGIGSQLRPSPTQNRFGQAAFDLCGSVRTATVTAGSGSLAGISVESRLAND